MAAYFDEAVGLDYSKGFIDAANRVLKDKYADLQGRVKFVTGDACNLDKGLGTFDAIFGGNLIDRLYDPEAFLQHVVEFMNKKSILVLASPYTWLLEYTKLEKWLGGYEKEGKPVSTHSRLKEVLTGLGLKEERPSEDVQFVIRENPWVYQYTSAQFTYWIK